jgi:UDP-N-acetylglucosamine--N-acetylmuramyl-(pentapeptide) pyrophosphoryl-undecaprenol N-acetylglucosamine transferase
MVHIAFTGGGTGGHIYPGLAVAVYLQKIMPCRIFWIGFSGKMDQAIVERGGLEFYGIPAGKLRRCISIQNLLDLFKAAAGFFAARRILKRERPALLFSKGGFVSVPPCAAAASLGIPVFTHESDYSPGLATRINVRFAARIFTAFEATPGFLPKAVRPKAAQTGNPIRPEFRAASAEAGRDFLAADPQEPLLLVLGGSLGAQRLNRLVVESLPGLIRRCTVAHQTGAEAQGIPPASARYRPYGFFREELPHVLAAADLVLCRSGAGTIWECAALGKPMLLLPLSGSGTRGDQVENARFLEKAGAALVLEDSVSPDSLIAVVQSLLERPEQRRSLGEAASRFAALDGGQLIAGAIREYLSPGNKE